MFGPNRADAAEVVVVVMRVVRLKLQVFRFIASICALAGGLALLTGCPRGGQAQAAPGERKIPPVSAVVETVGMRTVPISVDSLIGTVTAPQTVAVTSRIGGEIIKVNFSEGQEVMAGDVLFEIDPRSYEVALRQAEATLDRQKALKQQAEATRQSNQAHLENAATQRERNRKLVEQGIIARDTFETLDAQVKSLTAGAVADEATVQSAEQAIRAAETEIEEARLQISYCTLTAPIRGRAGGLLIDQGNIVQANSTTPLVTINQVRPIEVEFKLPEAYLNRVAARMREEPMPVAASIPDASLPTPACRRRPEH